MLFANNCNTTLASSLTSGATSMSVTSATGFPSPTGVQYFYCTLADAATQTTIEIVKVTSVTGTTFAITRAQDGTSATAFAAGAVVSLRLVRASLNDFPKLDETNTFNADQAISGQLTSSAGLATTGTFTATAPSDGLVMDYATGFGRFSAFAGDGFQWYNAGIANTKLMQLSSSGAITTATWNGATVTVPYGGTGLTTLTAGYVPYGNGTSAFNSSSNLTFSGQDLQVGAVGSVSQVAGGMQNTFWRIRERDNTDWCAWTTNINTSGTQDNSSMASWETQQGWGGGTDAWRVRRAPAGSSTFAELVRIDSSGNLLVGVAANDILGNRTTGFAVGPSLAGGQEMVIRASLGAKWSLTTTNATHMYFYSDNGSAAVLGGNISTNGSTTSYNASSDYRMKEDVQPMVNALQTVSKLNPVTYKWKPEFAGTSIYGQGFIAHELQEVVPDCVTGEKDAIDEEGNPIYQGIDTSFLVATLAASIQELNAKFDAYVASHP